MLVASCSPLGRIFEHDNLLIAARIAALLRACYDQVSLKVDRGVGWRVVAKVGRLVGVTSYLVALGIETLGEQDAAIIVVIAVRLETAHYICITRFEAILRIMG